MFEKNKKEKAIKKRRTLVSFLKKSSGIKKRLQGQGEVQVLQNLVGALEDLVFQIDKEGMFVFYHDPMAKQASVSSNAFVGKKYFDVLPEVLCASMREAIAQNRQNEKSAFGYALGDGKNFLAKMSPIFKDGAYDGSVIIVRDILSKEKALEEQREFLLKNLEETRMISRDLAKFKLAVDSISEQVIITDPMGVVLYANHATEEITGYALNEIIGKQAGTSWHLPMPREIYDEMWRVIRTDKKVYKGQLQNRRKNGEIYDTDVQIYPVLGENQELLFLVAIERDITKQKQIDRAKTNFVSLTSHLLRTPITAIRLFAEMLADKKVGTLNDIQKEYLNELSAAVKHMVQVINDLLNVSRIESNHLEIFPEAVQLEDVIQDTLDTFCYETDCSTCETQFKKPEQKSPMVLIDKTLMREVLYKILHNSHLYMREGVRCTIFVSLEYRNDEFVVAVFDNGMGIPEKDKSKVYDKFFRADNTSKVQTTGSGLGLYIVKNILEEAGCKIDFNSEEGSGTTFFVRIPNTGMKKKIGDIGEQEDF